MKVDILRFGAVSIKGKEIIDDTSYEFSNPATKNGRRNQLPGKQIFCRDTLMKNNLTRQDFEMMMCLVLIY